jgi:hypothetical protein
VKPGIAVITTLQQTSDPSLFDDLWQIVLAHLPAHEEELRAAIEGSVAVESRMPIGSVLLLFGVNADTRLLIVYDTIGELKARDSATKHLAERARADQRWLKKVLLPGLFQRMKPLTIVRLGG